MSRLSQTNPREFQLRMLRLYQNFQSQQQRQQAISAIQQGHPQGQPIATAAQAKPMQAGVVQPGLGQVPQMMGHQPVYNYTQMGMNPAMQGARMPQGYTWPMNRNHVMAIQQQQLLPQTQQQQQHQQYAGMQMMSQQQGQQGNMPQR